MSARPRRRRTADQREHRRAIIAGALALALVIVVQALGWFDGLEDIAAAWRFRHADHFAPAPPSDQITILGIDDQALARYGEWTDWSRSRLAGVIGLLDRLDARVIALDVRLETARKPSTDATLADAMRRHGNVIIAISETPPIEPIASAVAAFGSVAFDDAASGVLLEVPRTAHGAAQFGLVAAAQFEQRTMQDEAGALLVPWTDRQSEGTIGTARWSKALPVLSIGPVMQIAEEITQLEEVVSALLERRVTWPIEGADLVEAQDEAAFLRSELGGPPQDIIEQLDDVQDRTDEQQRTLVAAQLVAAMERLEERWVGPEQYGLTDYQRLESYVSDRLVFIGWTATGAIADFVPTPLGVRTPGVIVHAQIAAGQLVGFDKSRWPGSPGALFLVAALGLLGIALGCLPPLRAILLGIVTLLVWLVTNTVLLFDGLDLLVPLVAPAGAFGAALVTTASIFAASVHRDRARIRRQFRARIDPRLVDRLERDPSALRLDGELRTITVVFTDFSGYSALTEQQRPEDVVALLNDLQTVVTSALIEGGAYINKFLGDGVMAIWGAPEAVDNPVPTACSAVLAASRAVRKRGGPELRAGIATGQAIVGDCGAPPRLNDYTAIGDVVNIAARLADLGHSNGAPILMTAATQNQLDDALPTRDLGPTALAGRAQPVHVFELVQSTHDD